MENSDQNGTDRLSYLPEHILLHILSFLPTETVAATSVLSKSWQFLWTLVPNLDFDASRSHPTTVVPSFLYGHNFYGYKEYRSFANYVTRVLFHRRERFILGFRLKCNEPHDPSDLDLWVSYAIAHNVQELDLHIGPDRVSRPTFRFHFTQQSCKTLVVLKLKSVLMLDKVWFPVLKILHLKKSKFECQEAKFLPSCFPVLEELIISDPIDTNFKLYLPMLGFLTITLPWDCGLVKMDCPALTKLLVIDDYSRELHMENLLNLDKADIKIECCPGLYKDESDVMNVVKAISNVRFLRLSLPMMNEIELGSYPFFHGDEFPVFHNLVQAELSLKSCSREIMILILQKFRNLECLTLCYLGQGDDREGFGQGIGRRTVDVKELNQRTHVPNCLTSHLTTFCFKYFGGRGDEMMVTRYILKNSLVLKNMTILFPSWLVKDRARIRKKLRKSPRGSKGCELKFVDLRSSKK